MKKKIVVLLILLISATVLHAQRGLKVAYIDMEYILENVPEYQQAKQQLNARIQKWKGEIEAKMKNVEDLKKNLENERPLLTKELIEERQAEIQYEQEQITAYQQEKFGPAGDMITQKRQLIQPVQDQVFNAVQEVAQKREYDYILWNSEDSKILYAAKRHDISDQILAMIQRSSRKVEVEKRKDQQEADANKEDERYKSVIQAREDKEEAAEREAEKQAKIDEREAIMNERQRERDSIREARRLEYEQRRQKMYEERQRKRDSIQKAREEARNN